ncbi:MAG: hypothetical protein A2821_03560 [Candidatus Magasanikbacteria bacterium RIFCSPHIGHO2_01_FULL_41_23]|uniref:Glycosyltransferase subfamily 4-like N-terminal domain-containing protein n=1 Tax=Candidatus Magasanikbacteria bacterium RIFCSPLOWO2_01_FULL_40_15 TaxID=1798686 RepID=A0A1F6N1B4_9BACT|nr:MAG: hypothetical protein A2821_03560 [Candidatus Magasanikbacteria bacterium RIFCSPHIGHO2_01_FULL_41_23]OGH66626.1 MAG: hypothetical protein A3C66_03140 [Candidatus Magasanikbacteria bacterium RIFCSPHIGHO2_02_FULL_41_35]OGH74779.1 MAG: hypothetical protein A3F22_00925 [Candidatus Magasanikbacteria bacterium RIFCSPHIGHO2_12_FULL_41_16]OGH77755.1 MAG: hypothetical protein A2983_03900 [Candidatus Magasanikbacteria bacterium RIFCSPLOWO2_01_FULL_40_15]
MKIAQIVCRYPPYYSGMGTVVFETAVNLAKRGHSVEVITPEYYEAKEIKEVDEPEEKIHAPRLQKEIDYARRLEPSVTYGNAARLPNLDKELAEFDIVHLHYPFFGTANAVRRWKQKNPHKPLVVTYHMDTRATGWLDLVFKLYARYFMPKILSVADAIVSASFDYIQASDARDIYASQAKKWREIPFGVDIERFFPAKSNIEFLTNLGLDSNLPTVLFVGGMDHAHFFKGVPILLEALFLAKENGKPIQAIFVGDGERREQFMLKAKGLGLDSLVVFSGRVEHNDLPRFYQNSDILVLPSTTSSEAFGMVLLEAFASGTPVIASDLPGVRTVATQAGSVVKPNDPQDLARALLEYFSPEVDRAAWRVAARDVAEKIYAWPGIVARLEDLYVSLLKK